MRILLLTTMTLFFLRGASQRSLTYKFVVEKKIVVDSSTGTYAGSWHEYKYNRVFLGDSIFREQGLLSDGNNSTDLFKIRNGCWLFKDTAGWRKFYCPGENLSPTIKIAGNYYKLIIKDEKSLHGLKCFIYAIKPVNAQGSEGLLYWFNPKLGIIKIETNETSLVREDVLGK